MQARARTRLHGDQNMCCNWFHCSLVLAGVAVIWPFVRALKNLCLWPSGRMRVRRGRQQASQASTFYPLVGTERGRAPETQNKTRQRGAEPPSAAPIARACELQQRSTSVSSLLSPLGTKDVRKLALTCLRSPQTLYDSDPKYRES